MKGPTMPHETREQKRKRILRFLKTKQAQAMSGRELMHRLNVSWETVVRYRNGVLPATARRKQRLSRLARRLKSEVSQPRPSVGRLREIATAIEELAIR